MHPVWHVLVSTGVGWAVRRRTGRFPRLWWAASSFTDIDHYLWYALKTADWDPLRAWFGARDEHLRVGQRNLPLHRWRLIVLLMLLGSRYAAPRAIGRGLFFHRILDELSRWWPRIRYWRRRNRYYRHWYIVAERAGYRCQACGADDVILELHHRLAVSEGGRDHPDNMMVLCPSCHARAHART